MRTLHLLQSALALVNTGSSTGSSTSRCGPPGSPRTTYAA